MRRFNGLLRKSMAGQALVYVIVMLLAVSMGVFYVHNAYQISNEKTRLQNTADAAAYSVAVVEAKHLNYLAYTNRAMVANQVAIAQMITWVSWSRWLDTAATQLNDIGQYIPYIAAITAIIKQVATVIRNVVENVARVAISIIDRWIVAISGKGFQQLMYGGAVVDARAVFMDVVRKNDPAVEAGTFSGFNIGFASFAAGHSGFVKSHGVRDAKMDQFRSVTMASRDGFTEDRTYNLFEGFGFKVRRAGGTQLLGGQTHNGRLVNPYTAWSAMDTMSLHVKPLFGRWRETNILGVGSAVTGEKICTQCHRDQHYWHTNPGASECTVGHQPRVATTLVCSDLANEFEDPVGRYSGLQPFFDLKDKGLVERGPGITFYLRKPKGSVRTVKQTDFGRNAPNRIDIGEYGGMAADYLHSVSAAHTYFSRPNDLWGRDNGGREYGNLYNPYWKARLQSVDNRAKAAITAMVTR